MLSTVVSGIAVPLLFACWTSRGRLNGSPWPAVAALAWFGLQLARAAAGNVRAPHEWDYACFWLYGHVAAAHLNVYDPASYARFALPFRPSNGFRESVLAVGFPYPPPAIALFLPLGAIPDFRAGLVVWYVIQFAALAGAAWVLARTFMPAHRWRSALLVLAVIAALPASFMNVWDAQTNYVLLLLLALALQSQAASGGAIWTVLAIWVKPYAAALVLLDAVRGGGRRLIVTVVAAAVSLVAAAAILGPVALAEYGRANPAGREPSAAFVEPVNQSLLAIFLRLHAVLPPHVSILAEPAYLAAAGVLAVLTIVLCARRAAARDVAFAAMLLLGLIVYPGTLSSYGVVLVIPLLVLWRRRADFPGGAPALGTLFAVVVLLQSSQLQRGFEANVLVWLACVSLLLTGRRGVAIINAPVVNRTLFRDAVGAGMGG